MQTVQTKCNAFEVTVIRLYSSLKMRKHLYKWSKLKWDSHAYSPNSHFLYPSHSYFPQGLVIAKIDIIPLAKF